MPIQRRDIVDFGPSRNILEDAVVKRYDGFVEAIPQRVDFEKKKCLI